MELCQVAVITREKEKDLHGAMEGERISSWRRVVDKPVSLCHCVIFHNIQEDELSKEQSLSPVLYQFGIV